MFHEDRQRHCDSERGRADVAERFRSYDWRAGDSPKVHTAPPYSHEDFLRNQAEIEADEELKNRMGIPPLPTTKVTLQKL